MYSLDTSLAKQLHVQYRWEDTLSWHISIYPIFNRSAVGRRLCNNTLLEDWAILYIAAQRRRKNMAIWTKLQTTPSNTFSWLWSFVYDSSFMDFLPKNTIDKKSKYWVDAKQSAGQYLSQWWAESTPKSITSSYSAVGKGAIYHQIKQHKWATFKYFEWNSDKHRRNNRC